MVWQLLHLPHPCYATGHIQKLVKRRHVLIIIIITKHKYIILTSKNIVEWIGTKKLTMSAMWPETGNLKAKTKTTKQNISGVRVYTEGVVLECNDIFHRFVCYLVYLSYTYYVHNLEQTSRGCMCVTLMINNVRSTIPRQ